jgi:hypothetical protein
MNSSERAAQHNYSALCFGFGHAHETNMTMTIMRFSALRKRNFRFHYQQHVSTINVSLETAHVKTFLLSIEELKLLLLPSILHPATTTFPLVSGILCLWHFTQQTFSAYLLRRASESLELFVLNPPRSSFKVSTIRCV